MRSSDAILASLGFVTTIASGCFSPLDHTGRRCPCASGYVCDTSTDTCVADGADAASIDASRIDAGPSDAGPSDVGPSDAFSLDTDEPTLDVARADDAFAMDAPGVDAPAIDAWSATIDAWAADARATDAWAPDAFAVDARALDAFVSPDAGPDPCPTGAWLCDDFESMVSSRVPPWGYSDGAAARTTERAYRGSASGRFEFATVGATQSVGRTLMPPADLWMRGWVYVRARMGGGRRDAAFFHMGDDTAPGYDNVSVVLGDDPMGLFVGTYNTSSGMYHQGTRISDDTWTCVAVHVRTGAMGYVELHVGSALAVSSAESVSFAGGGIRVVDVGITYSGDATAGVTLYLDDVAVSTSTPLGCD